MQKKKERLTKDNSLFELLKQLRKEISAKEKLPPYVIFPDSTLQEMSKLYPLDAKSLLNIKGVGENKLEKYGELFLGQIKKYVEENNIVITETTNEYKQPNKQISKTPSHLITFEMYQAGVSIEKIAQQREVAVNTVQNHIIQCALEGLAVDLDAFIPQQYEEQILQAIKNAGGEKLKPIKEELPPEVDYFAIKAVMCKYK